MFVYSVGFYELLRDVSRGATGKKVEVLCAMWKVFSILLEHSCKQDYKLMVTKMTEANKIELENQDKNFTVILTKMREEETRLRSALACLEKYN